MKLLLVRHAETVDNVAQIYAGVTDSALTVHGSVQATRLGEHLAVHQRRITHIFSSDLSRARRTAEAVLKAQRDRHGTTATSHLKLVQSSDLREQDFGSTEGISFANRQRMTAKATTAEGGPGNPSRNVGDFRDVESKRHQATRAGTFLDDHLLPVLNRESHVGPNHESFVVVVSHGMLLSVLWKCLVKRFPPHQVTLNAEIQLPNRNGHTDILHIGAWSNTGYLQLRIQPNRKEAKVNSKPKSLEAENVESRKDMSTLHDWHLDVVATNCRGHLHGLKRTRGVGSSKFDAGQRSLDRFFAKKQRTQ